MILKERKSGSVTILDIDGKILLGEGDVQLKRKIDELIEQESLSIILNCANIPYMDSGGLAEVVRSYTTVKRAGGELCLLNTAKRITDLLTITKLIAVFQIFEEESEAVKWLNNPIPYGLMTVTRQDNDGITILRCHPNKKEGIIEDTNLTTAVDEVCRANITKIILDARQVASRSDWFITHLYRIKMSRAINGVRIKVVGTVKVREQLAAANADALFDFVPSLKQATTQFEQ